MAVFEYRGIAVTSGKTIKGVKDAENVKALRMSLRRDGVLLTTATEEKEAKIKARGNIDLKRILQRVTINDVALMTRQLATLVRAKIPLFEALSALIEQVEKDALRNALTNVRDQVREGTSFADALAAHPKIFTDMYINMVRAGEASGTLEGVLERLTSFMENQAKLRGKIGSALAYPALMMVLSVIMMSVMMVSVVPKVTSVFSQMNQEMPWYTQLLITVSDFMANWWWLMLGATIGGWYAFRRWRSTPSGKLKWDTFILKAPLFGKLTKMVAIARFARTLATLLGAGVALLQAMGIVRKVLGNACLELVVEEATSAIREGQSIAEPLKASGKFPPLVIHMIAIGEKSGELEEMLENVAIAYDTAVDTQVGVLTSLLEPLIIAVMGLGIGFIAWAMLSPMVQVSTFVH